jgi:hypothetical protein
LLKHYQWLVNGVVTSQALHGAVALASVILDLPDAPNSAVYQAELAKFLGRMETLSTRSPVCSRAYGVARQLQ